MKISIEPLVEKRNVPEIKKKTIDLDESKKKNMWNLYRNLYKCMYESDIPLELKLSCCGTVLAEYAVLAGVSGDTVIKALRKSYDHFLEKNSSRIIKETCIGI